MLWFRETVVTSRLVSSMMHCTMILNHVTPFLRKCTCVCLILRKTFKLHLKVQLVVRLCLNICV